jgi:hypothetical protein
MSAYMKGSRLLTSLFLGIFAIAQPALAVQIVQVDTGTAPINSSALRLHADSSEVWHEHGHQMALALESQLQQEFLVGTSAIQVLWERDDVSSVARGILKAAAYLPRVISLSLAGEVSQLPELIAVKYATDMGILVLAASGNHHFDHPEYPAAHSKQVDCMLAVGTISHGARARYSNISDIYLEEVPGESGTSFSAARAAAIALRHMAEYPGVSCKRVKLWMVGKFGPARLGIK